MYLQRSTWLCRCGDNGELIGSRQTHALEAERICKGRAISEGLVGPLKADSESRALAADDVLTLTCTVSMKDEDQAPAQGADHVASHKHLDEQADIQAIMQIQ